MKNKIDYKKIVKHYENCFIKFGDNHKGLDWPNKEDLLKRYNIALEITRNEKCSLLDFGCGTAGLLEHINNSKISNIKYFGLDLSEKYIETCINKFPEMTFYLIDILEESKKLPNFDYVIMNGVFTEKRELSFHEMWSYCQKTLIKVFEKAEKGIAFNVMSKEVDWERKDLFHLSTDLLISFISKQLSGKFIIRSDYGLYEYFVYVYK